jgi:alkanesulfonate monooxygenase
LTGNAGVSSRSGQMVDLARRNNWTLRQLYQYFAGTRGHFSLIGSPSQVVDQMQEWFEAEGCDGFNVLVSSFPDDFELFVDLVVPELQRRGLFRTAYAGPTLRDNLGLKRPDSRFARARSEAAE